MLLKNTAQRKSFLQNYQTWEKISEIPELNVVFYKITLPTKATIVVTEWNIPKTKYLSEHKGYRHCLIFDKKEHIGALPRGSYYEQEYFKEYRLEGTSESFLVDYLKANRNILDV